MCPAKRRCPRRKTRHRVCPFGCTRSESADAERVENVNLQRSSSIRWLAVALALSVGCLWFVLDSSLDRVIVPEIAASSGAVPTNSIERKLEAELATAQAEESEETQRAPVASTPTSERVNVDERPGTLVVTATD